jgi:hypothetical protein
MEKREEGVRVMKAWRREGPQKDIPRSTCLKATASFKSLEPVVVEMKLRGY